MFSSENCFALQNIYSAEIGTELVDARIMECSQSGCRADDGKRSEMDWRTLLLAFGILWAVQVAGTALQMRHYRRFIATLVARWSDGAIGSGNARARFGRGVIAVLVVSPGGIVREAFAMQGRTVWAKFRPLDALRGRELAAVRDGRAFAEIGRAHV